MKKDNIFQFVSFITDAGYEEFVENWEAYAREAASPPVLLQLANGKGKFKYISKHECGSNNFRFAFKKGMHAERFADQKTRIVQFGGYTSLQEQFNHADEKEDFTIVAFLSKDETDLEFYRQLSFYRHLNIYQAYYESCTYGYILEFCTPGENTGNLISRILSRKGSEAAIYRECIATDV